MYFTHSFNTHKIYEFLKKEGLASRVYLNKLNESKDLKKVVDRYASFGDKVIIDSPIYASTMIAGADNFEDMLTEKKLSKEVLKKSAFNYKRDPKQFVKDVEGCWKAYLDSVGEFGDSVEKVLSLPSYKSMSEDTWTQLLSVIQPSNYQYISFAISNTNTDAKYLGELYNRVKLISESKGINKFLFTHLRDFKLYEYSKEEVANINNFLNDISKIGEVVVHHMNDYIFYLDDSKNIAPSIGFYNQTKYMCKESHPFITIDENSLRRKTDAVFVASLMSEVKIDKLIANEKAGNIDDISPIVDVLSMTKQNSSKLGVPRRTISMAYEFEGYQNVIKMDQVSKRNAVSAGIDFIEALNKRQQKEIMYPITANLYKKIL